MGFAEMCERLNLNEKHIVENNVDFMIQNKTKSVHLNYK